MSVESAHRIRNEALLAAERTYESDMEMARRAYGLMSLAICRNRREAIDRADTAFLEPGDEA